MATDKKISGLSETQTLDGSERIPFAKNGDNGSFAASQLMKSYGMPVVTQTEASATIQPDVLNKWGEVASLTIDFAAGTEGYAHEYCIEFVSGATVWLDYNMRQRMRTKIEAALRDGNNTATLWFGTVCFELSCDLATNLIWLVEKYAAACYDVTAFHKAAVEAFDSIEAVNAYDHTAGYPEKPNITI